MQSPQSGVGEMLQGKESGELSSQKKKKKKDEHLKELSPHAMFRMCWNLI